MTQILIIEDEEKVRFSLCEMLKTSDYTVIEAANGSSAIALCENQPVDIVITDLVMPEMDGFQTIMQLKEKYPQMKILAISGGMPDCRNSPNVLLPLASKLGADALLKKPFTLDELLEALKEMRCQ